MGRAASKRVQKLSGRRAGWDASPLQGTHHWLTDTGYSVTDAGFYVVWVQGVEWLILGQLFKKTIAKG